MAASVGLCLEPQFMDMAAWNAKPFLPLFTSLLCACSSWKGLRCLSVYTCRPAVTLGKTLSVFRDSVPSFLAGHLQLTSLFLKGREKNKKSEKSEESQTDTVISRKVCCSGHRMPCREVCIFWKISPGAVGGLVPEIPNTYGYFIYRWLTS